MLAVEGFTVFSNFIIWLNLMGALIAVASTVWASRIFPKIMQRTVLSISFLAGLYSVAYVLLLTDTLALGQWSEIMRGVSVAAWPIAWSYPWIKMGMLHKKLIENQRNSLTAIADLSRVLVEKSRQLGEGKL